MSSKWDKKYAGVDKALIEELAELRHNQMRAWSKEMVKLLSKFQYEHKNLDEFADEMLKLCSNNWVDYPMVPEELKTQSRIFAFAVVDILRKYYKLQQ